MILEGMTEAQADVEIARIKEEEKANMPQLVSNPEDFNMPMGTEKHTEGNPVTDEANKDLIKTETKKEE